MANQDSTNEARIDYSNLTYEVLSVRAQIRSAVALLTSSSDYGKLDSGGAGETLCDVGFILTDADKKLGVINLKADHMELDLSLARKLNKEAVSV